jgi:hypothetical protein
MRNVSHEYNRSKFLGSNWNQAKINYDGLQNYVYLHATSILNDTFLTLGCSTVLLAESDWQEINQRHTYPCECEAINYLRFRQLKHCVLEPEDYKDDSLIKRTEGGHKVNDW